MVLAPGFARCMRPPLALLQQEGSHGAPEVELKMTSRGPLYFKLATVSQLEKLVLQVRDLRLAHYRRGEQSNEQHLLNTWQQSMLCLMCAESDPSF